MMRFALITAIWLLAILTIVLLNSEHQPANGGTPLVKSSVAQGDIAKVNTLFTPCPSAPRNLPRLRREEQA